MTFNVSSAELLKGLIDVSKAIPNKTTLPILENFLFVLNGNTLEITASDTELTLQTSIEVEVIENGDNIAVPATHLTELLKVLPDQPITIKTINSTSFECVWSNGNSVLPYYPSDDYPDIPTSEEEAINIEVPHKCLIEGITSTVYATADDEKRPAINGIFFDIDVDTTTLVASDTQKLICYTTNEIQAQTKTSFILHKKIANIVRTMFAKGSSDDDKVTITFDTKTIILKYLHMVVVCRLIIGGKYPKYKDVIPQNNSNILSIDRNVLLNAIKRVSVCTNKASNHIKLDFKPGILEISAQDIGFAIAAYEKIDCDYSGEELTIGFKSTYLIEILSNINCEQVVIKFADARRAALITPHPDEKEAQKICGILVPVFIS